MNTATEATLFPITPEEPFKVTIQQHLTKELVTKKNSDDLPVYGLLLGKKSKSKNPDYKILQTHEVGGDMGKGMAVIKKEAMVRLRRKMAKNHPDLSILGWYTVHDVGASPTPREEDTHRLFFAEPWNLFLAIDLSKQKPMLFRFEKGSLRETKLRIANAKKPAAPRNREHKTLLAEIEKLKSEKHSLEKALETKAAEVEKEKAEKILIKKSTEERADELFNKGISSRGNVEKQKLNLTRSMAEKEGRIPRSYANGDKVIQLPVIAGKKPSQKEITSFGRRMLALAAAVLVLLVIIAVMNILSEHSDGGPALSTHGISNTQPAATRTSPREKPESGLTSKVKNNVVAGLKPDSTRKNYSTDLRPSTLDVRPDPLPDKKRATMRPAIHSRPNPRIYVVKKGDYLGKIAQKTLGSSRFAEKIRKYNGLSKKAATRLQIGQKIKIPPK